LSRAMLFRPYRNHWRLGRSSFLLARQVKMLKPCCFVSVRFLT
jgi:hypothetical protein